MSGPTVMLTLGQFKFQLATAVYQELKRKTEYRWGKQDRFGQAPVRQFTGLGDDTITLPGVIFPGWQGGRGQVDAMRAMAAQGQPMVLVGGDGVVMGRWVVESIEEGQSNFVTAGAALRQEFTLNLAKFGEVEPAGSVGGLAGLGSGLASVTSLAGQATAAADQAAGLAGGVTSALASAQASISAVVGTVQQNLGPAIAAVKQGMTVAANLKNAAIEARGLVKRVGNIKSLADAEGALGSLMRVASSTSAVSTGAGAVLNSTVGQLVAGGAPADALAAVKGALVTMNKLTTGVTAIRKQTDGIVNSFKRLT